MKLNQYKEKKNNKKLAFVIVAIIFLIGGIILDRTFANFKVQKSFKVMEGNFIYEGKGDIIFAFYNTYKNQTLTNMPKKKDGYVFVKGECDKGASVEWSDTKWAPTILNLDETKTTCSLYFKKYPEIICDTAGDDSGACYLTKRVENNKTNMIYDETEESNLRFIGSNPNNYIDIGDTYTTDIYAGYYNMDYSSTDIYKEFIDRNACTNHNYGCSKIHSAGDKVRWRIIGVMNNIEDESGNISSHIKIVRESIGLYSWDSSESSVNNGDGVNEWSEADIQKVLNENFYSREDGGICYRISDNSNYAADCPIWSSMGLSENARSIISKIKWKIGGSSDGAAMAVYKNEQSGIFEKCKNVKSFPSALCNDEVPRTTSWTGYVGLPYASDLGFANSGGDSKTRKDCMDSMNSWSTYNNNYCVQYSWLAGSTQWTMTPMNNYYGYGVLYRENISNYQYVREGEASGGGMITPVVYLNSNVKIEEDDDENYGSINNPFRIKLQ